MISLVVPLFTCTMAFWHPMLKNEQRKWDCLVCVSVTLHGSATVPHTDAGRAKSWPVRGHETTLGAHVWTLTHATVDETQMTTEHPEAVRRRITRLIYSLCSKSETQASALLLSQMCSNLNPLRHEFDCADTESNDNKTIQIDHFLLQDRSNRREPVFQLR